MYTWLSDFNLLRLLFKKLSPRLTLLHCGCILHVHAANTIGLDPILWIMCN